MSGILLLGLDAGTTACKAAVIDESGREVSHGRSPTPWRAVPTGAEIDPAGFVACAIEAAGEALAAAPAGRVAAVGVAGMAETGVLLDDRGEPVVPSIAWHDARGADQARRLAADLGEERFTSRAGVPAGPLCTLVKYRWMREHGDDAARGVRWLNVPEWIVRGLGGDEVSELSLACRTGMLDVHARAWWDEALAWAGAPPGLMPEPAEAGTPAGTVSPEALPAAAGAVLAVGGHDHLSAAVGAGAAGEGDVLDSCGTAEAWVRAVAPLPPERVAGSVARGITVGWHAVPGRQALLGSIRTGAILQRVLDLLGVPAESRAALERAALDAEPGGLELRGIRAETLELHGIGREVSPARVWRAALESTGAAGAGVLGDMAGVAGPHTRLVVTGGWAEGEAARAVKAAHLGPFEHAPEGFTGARGAALTAGRAAGLWSIDEAPRRGAAEEVGA